MILYINSFDYSMVLVRGLRWLYSQPGKKKGIIFPTKNNFMAFCDRLEINASNQNKIWKNKCFSYQDVQVEILTEKTMSGKGTYSALLAAWPDRNLLQKIQRALICNNILVIPWMQDDIDYLNSISATAIN